MPVYLIDFPNHQQVRVALRDVFTPATLAKYDRAVADTCRCYLRLANLQLEVARAAIGPRNGWRTVVSRGYYASYSTSKAIRLYVAGYTVNDTSDHKKVGELPDDFPDREDWVTTLVDMRFDRNIADYEPWPGSKARLKNYPKDTFDYAKTFVAVGKVYLRGRGLL